MAPLALSLRQAGKPGPFRAAAYALCLAAVTAASTASLSSHAPTPSVSLAEVLDSLDSP